MFTGEVIQKKTAMQHSIFLHQYLQSLLDSFDEIFDFQSNVNTDDGDSTRLLVHLFMFAYIYVGIQ